MWSENFRLRIIELQIAKRCFQNLREAFRVEYGGNSKNDRVQLQFNMPAPDDGILTYSHSSRANLISPTTAGFPSFFLHAPIFGQVKSVDKANDVGNFFPSIYSPYYTCYSLKRRFVTIKWCIGLIRGSMTKEGVPATLLSRIKIYDLNEVATRPPCFAYTI